MIKAGVLHDYDLMANAEPTAKDNVCVICGAAPVTYQWSDYHGEAMCTACGCPYQLRAGGAEREAEGDYPYLNMIDDLIEPLRAYHAETGWFTCLGTMMGPTPGQREFINWLETNRPDVYEKCVSKPE